MASLDSALAAPLLALSLGASVPASKLSLSSPPPLMSSTCEEGRDGERDGSGEKKEAGEEGDDVDDDDNEDEDEDDKDEEW